MLNSDWLQGFDFVDCFYREVSFFAACCTPLHCLQDILRIGRDGGEVALFVDCAPCKDYIVYKCVMCCSVWPSCLFGIDLLWGLPSNQYFCVSVFHVSRLVCVCKTGWDPWAIFALYGDCNACDHVMVTWRGYFLCWHSSWWLFLSLRENAVIDSKHDSVRNQRVPASVLQTEGFLHPYSKQGWVMNQRLPASALQIELSYEPRGSCVHTPNRVQLWTKGFLRPCSTQDSVKNQRNETRTDPNPSDTLRTGRSVINYCSLPTQCICSLAVYIYIGYILLNNVSLDHYNFIHFINWLN